MLTTKLVRVRFVRDRVRPCYLEVADSLWLEAAERLIRLYLANLGQTRGALEAEVRDSFGSDASQLVYQGLAKLLEDRCEFEVISGREPDRVREAVFSAAALDRRRDGKASGHALPRPFSREIVLDEAATALGLSREGVEQALFADLKSEQKLIRFKETTPQRLLERYNVALAQGVLLRSSKVHVTIRNERPERFRQLFRLLKFHRLMCQLERLRDSGYLLHLDGPLSLFAATQKYGLQLALFLPAILLCRDWDIRAELLWGAQRKPKCLLITPEDGLVSHMTDAGTYVPQELAMFVELFRKKIPDWEIHEETEVLPLDDSFWAPDFRLCRVAGNQSVFLEVLGFWRKSTALRHLERLRQSVREPFLLAVSDQLRLDDAELEGLPAAIYRFRQMPLPEEVVRLAAEITNRSETDHSD
jgi:predicted nuclease of restriction endonuclease-like RecB superfamily